MSPPPTAASRPSRKMLWRLSLLGLAAVLLIGGLVGYWVVMPQVAENMVRSQLDRLETRLGLELETGTIRTSGWEGVIIESFRATPPGEETP
ncbi:MAG: hypothetical protein ACNA8W_13265, partial [Bradymonadaceae bacterium]